MNAMVVKYFAVVFMDGLRVVCVLFVDARAVCCLLTRGYVLTLGLCVVHDTLGLRVVRDTRAVCQVQEC